MIVNETTLLPSISVPASPDQLSVLRALVRVATAQHPLAVDALADLVLAVDEAACILLMQAVPTGYLTCIFGIDPGGHLRVHLSTSTSHPIDVTTTSCTWLVLEGLVDDVTAEQIPPTSENEYFTATITVKKKLPTIS